MGEKELKWLKSKQGVLKIRFIEKEIGMPEGTLSKYVANKRGMTAAWEEKVASWVKKFKK